MFQGMAFGAGSEVAHTAVRGMMGGDSHHHSQAPPQQAPPPQNFEGNLFRFLSLDYYYLFLEKEINLKVLNVLRKTIILLIA